MLPQRFRSGFRAAALLAFVVILPSGGTLRADAPHTIPLDDALRDRCVAILRAGFTSNEFWPSMHAAEALTQAGYGREVLEKLKPKLEKEEDLQRRCGLAREMTRAGDRAYVRVLFETLTNKNPHGHIHACESLFKVNEIGDGAALRAAFEENGAPSKTIMAAASLARSGNLPALAAMRKLVRDEKGEVSMIAAWALGRLGDASDVPALRDGAARYFDPAVRAFFEHALAALGDPAGMAALIKNLSHKEAAVRIYAAEFAPDARAVDARDGLIRLLDDENLDARIRGAQALIRLSKPTADDRNEVIVREVYPATPHNPRYSEGTVIDRRDGSLTFLTTEFFEEESDFAKARLIAKDSSDEGRTWSEARVVQENTGKLNVISASLRRLGGHIGDDVPLGLFFCQTNSYSDLPVLMRVSTDDGRTFGDPRPVSTVPGYHCVNNDRIIRLQSGRLLCPAASTEDVIKTNHFRSCCFLSDDNGKTWRKGKGDVDYGKRGAMEPETLELKNGRVLMHFRTQLGHIGVSESSDGGETWSEPKSLGVRAPESPATLRRIPSTGDLLLIWNDSFSEGEGHGGKRTPLTAAISQDEGKTWIHKRNIESKPGETYAYTSVLFHNGRAVLSYYVGDDKTARISSRFRSLPVSWFYDAANSN